MRQAFRVFVLLNMKRNGFQIFAHRGLLREFPENSFPALAEALRRGFGLETDLRLTRDDDFVIVHDDTFTRLTGTDKKVADLTLAEAENLQYLKSKEKIISLRRLLEWLKTNPAPYWNAIHLKDDSQTEDGLRLVARYWKEFDLYDNFFVFDLTQQAAVHLKEINSQIRIALIVSEYKFEQTIHLWKEVKNFPYFDIVWAAEYRKLYSKNFINEVRSLGKAFYAMSPDVHVQLGHPLARGGYEKTWAELIEWGAEGICSDYPEKLEAYLQTLPV